MPEHEHESWSDVEEFCPDSVPVATFHEYAEVGICGDVMVPASLVISFLQEMETECQGAVVSNDVLDSILRMYTDGCHVSTTLANAILKAQSNAWQAQKTEEK